VRRGANDLYPGGVSFFIPPVSRIINMAKRRAATALLATGFVVWFAAGHTPSLWAQGAAAAPVTLEAVVVSPERPAAETLCQLRVTLENRSERTISALGFDVLLEGRPLPVYESQLFMDLLPPGTSTTVRLFNFWSSEDGRPAPPDSELELEVRLREARWLAVTHEDNARDREDGAGAREDGAGRVELWTLEGEVPGLPIAKARVLILR
jgi:hypothetical protein